MNKQTIDYIVREQDLITQDLSTYLKRHEKKEMLRLLVAGSVDDGKSTLIGRLLYDSHLIYRDHLESIYQDSKVFNTTENEIDLSLLTDGLRAEREQGITIDVAYRYFSTEKKSFIICDAPGHEQYTRNMATGASHCEMALILIDARNGVQAQTRRHSLIATIMGIQNIVVVINKMDLVDYSESVFQQICEEYLDFSAKMSINSIDFVPISALTGENVVTKAERMSWYTGEPLLSFLENVKLTGESNLTGFRFPVQYVIRPNSDFRGYAGSVASGVVHEGDEIVVLPSGKHTRIKDLKTYDGYRSKAFPGMPVVLTVENEIDISRGTILAKPDNLPTVTNKFDATIVWMDEEPMKCNNEYLLKCNAQCVPVRIKSIYYKYNINELTHIKADELSLNDIGKVELLSQRPLICDSFTDNKEMGAFILISRDTNATSGGGVIELKQINNAQKGQNLSKEVSFVTTDQRIKMLGHKPATLWLTGLSGSGKSTIAKILEAKLLERGILSYILDGDNLRQGLNSDLGFSPEDRCENIRRAAEVAKLMNDAGLVVIAAFISPYQKDREEAARIIGSYYTEVYVDADIESCMQRDPKGLYAKHAAGAFKGLTGVDAPYEAPLKPTLHVNTTQETEEVSSEKVLNFLLSVI